MRVREHDPVERGDVVRIEDFTDVPRGVGRARVDERGVTVVALEECAVALADVDERDAEKRTSRSIAVASLCAA
jgi:hypothetical protein